MPTVSIGMPVYNGASYLRAALDSILSQSFADFELIISDNASVDNTGCICLEYARMDNRIRYIRQESNIGAFKNFQFVLRESVGKYFMWAAVDDLRTPDYIKNNVSLLDSFPLCAFSSSTNCFEDEAFDSGKKESFELTGNLFDRLSGFIDICWHSHACFYSLIRREALSEVLSIQQNYLAFDWSCIVILLKQGEFRRVSQGVLTLGRSGESMQPNFMKSMRALPIETILPLYRFSTHLIGIINGSSELSISAKGVLLYKIIVLNVNVFYGQTRAALASYVKHMLRKCGYKKSL